MRQSTSLSLSDVYVPVHARLETPKGETWQRIARRYQKGDEVGGPEALDSQRQMPCITLETIYTRFVEKVGYKEPYCCMNRDFNNPLSPMVSIS